MLRGAESIPKYKLRRWAGANTPMMAELLVSMDLEYNGLLAQAQKDKT